MIVKGADRTITHQKFAVDVAKDGQDRSLVFHCPDGTAHVFALGQRAREQVMKDLSLVDVAGAGAIPPQPNGTGAGG